MSNIKISVPDIGNQLKSDLALAKSLNKEIDSINSKAKTSNLKGDDLDRIRKLETQRDLIKQRVDNTRGNALAQSQYQQIGQPISNFYNGVQSLTNLTALQKLTSGQRLNVSDSINVATSLAGPVYQLIQKFFDKKQQGTSPVVGNNVQNTQNPSLFGVLATGSQNLLNQANVQSGIKSKIESENRTSIIEGEIQTLRSVMVGQGILKKPDLSDLANPNTTLAKAASKIGITKAIDRKLSAGGNATSGLGGSGGSSLGGGGGNDSGPSSLEPGGKIPFLPPGSIFEKINALLPAGRLAFESLKALKDKFDLQDENTHSARELLNTHIRGTINQDVKERFLGDFGYSGANPYKGLQDIFEGRTWKEYYDNPNRSYAEDKSAQGKLTSAFGNSGANFIFRESMKIVGLENEYDTAVENRRKELGRELSDSEYEQIRTNFLSRRDMINASKDKEINGKRTNVRYTNWELNQIQRKINNDQYDRGEIGRYELLKRRLGITWAEWSGVLPDAVRPKQAEQINDLTNLRADEFQRQMKLPEKYADRVLTNNEMIREHQVSEKETFYSNHRRTRTSYPLTDENFMFGRMGHNIILFCLMSYSLISLLG